MFSCDDSDLYDGGIFIVLVTFVIPPNESETETIISSSYTSPSSS